MAKEINPFIVTGKIEPEYFCDRVKESERLGKPMAITLSLSHPEEWVKRD